MFELWGSREKIFSICVVPVNYVIQLRALTPLDLLKLYLSALNVARGSCLILETTTVVDAEQLPRSV